MFQLKLRSMVKSGNQRGLKMNTLTLRFILRVIESCYNMEQLDIVQGWIDGMNIAEEDLEIIQTNIQAKRLDLDFK